MILCRSEQWKRRQALVAGYLLFTIPLAAQLGVDGEKPGLAEAMVLYKHAKSTEDKGRAAFWVGVHFSDPDINAGNYALAINYFGKSIAQNFQPAIPRLFKYLRSLSERDQHRATRLIGKMAGQGNQPLLKAILEAANHPNAQTRQGAIYLLRYALPAKNLPVREALQKALQDENEQVRQAAGMPVPGAESAKKKVTPYARARQVRQLSPEEGLARVQGLLKEAQDGDEDAVDVLASLGKTKLRDDLRSAALRALATLSVANTKARNLLIAHTNSHVPEVRRDALLALSKPAAEEPELFLKLLYLSTGNPYGPAAIEKCFELISAGRDYDVLQAKLEVCLKSPSPEVTKAALEGMTKAFLDGKTDVANLLVQRAREEAPKYRAAILPFLGKIASAGSMQAREIVVDAVKSRVPDLMAAGMVGLGYLATEDGEALEMLKRAGRLEAGEAQSACEGLGVAAGGGGKKALFILQRMFELPEFEQQKIYAGQGLGVAVGHGSTEALAMLMEELGNEDKGTARSATEGLTRAVELGSEEALANLISVMAETERKSGQVVREALLKSALRNSRTLWSLLELATMNPQKEPLNPTVLSILADLSLQNEEARVLLENLSKRNDKLGESGRAELERIANREQP